MMSFLHSHKLFAVSGLGCLLFSATAVAQPAAPVSLGSAETFAVLGGTSVANAGATTVNGDLGVFPGSTLPLSPPLTLHPSASRHAGDAVAARAASDAAAAFDELTPETCATTLTTAAGVYAGGALSTPGTYCFDTANVQITGNLQLTGPGYYVFKVDGTLTTSDAVQVSYSSVTSACKGSNVFWQVSGPTATLGQSNLFVGSLLAQDDVTLGSGTVVDGRVVSLDGDVALTANVVTACTNERVFPAYTAIKVTGGGGIDVTTPGNGFANYGFNAHPGAAGVPATGSFNYLNHTLGPPPYHLHGTVTDVDVVSGDSEGVAEIVRLSGTCDRVANCTFSALVQDNGEPGRDDQFGVTVVLDGEVVEEQEVRQVRNGNIQFHTSTLETEVNTGTLRGGQTLRLSARLRRDRTVATPADAYVVLRLPNGQMLSWTGSALVPGLVPLVRNFIPVDVDGPLLQVQVPPGTPPGVYTWLSGLTDAGTLNLRSGISERTFTILP
jgi:Ice-binding-like